MPFGIQNHLGSDTINNLKFFGIGISDTVRYCFVTEPMYTKSIYYYFPTGLAGVKFRQNIENSGEKVAADSFGGSAKTL